MNIKNDCLIIGAGALGLATAQALLSQGAAVTVLERGSVGRESSWAGGGILSPLCPWDYPDEVSHLALRGMALFGDFAGMLHQTTGIDPEYQRSGMLVLPPLDVQAALKWCSAHGMACLPSDETTSHSTTPASGQVAGYPNGGGIVGGGEALFLPDVAQARNPRLLQSLRASVELLGGRIVEQCEVKQIVPDVQQVKHLATTQGDFRADAYIVTAGAWSKVLLGEHALKADIKPIRGQMLLFKFDTPPLPHILLQHDVYLIPRRDGHLLVGSTREDVGFDKNTTDEARETLLQRGIALLPALRDMPVIKHWAGLRPASPGNIPTIGRHPHLTNLYINSGHFRYGVTMSPASVEVLLNSMNGSPQPFDVSPYLWH